MRSLLISIATSSVLIFSLSGCGGSSPTTAPPAVARLGSYVVIGDWGHDNSSHGENLPTAHCQDLIAQKLNETMAELGDVNFIVNVGDSFYPMGVSSKDDPQWNVKWRNRYSDLVRSVPWFSVYGNHDYHQDPGVCSDNVSDGAQINGDIEDLDTFYMPDYNWHLEWPELEMEIIGLELNNYMNGWKNGENGQPRVNASDQNFTDCRYTACEQECYPRMKQRSDEAFELFKSRAAATEARNVLVFSHYPTDYFWDTAEGDPSHDFLQGLSEAGSVAGSDANRYHLKYFGGHRHSTDQSSTLPITPNDSWLSGGGGGWSCDTNQQGFVVGEIHADWTMTTRVVLVDADDCCDPIPDGRADTTSRRPASAVMETDV